MKVCEICGDEIFTKDGENACESCDQREATRKAKNAKRSAARRAREEALRSCGLVKVHGALGGEYWE
jgi:uncharacterized Zn finger protein (UPF0148 family)